MDGLTELKQFIDLGSTAIIAIALLYIYWKQFQTISEKLDRILTFLAILTKTTTNFNGVDSILGKSGDKVNQLIIKAETKPTLPPC